MRILIYEYRFLNFFIVRNKDHLHENNPYFVKIIFVLVCVFKDYLSAVI